MRRESVIAFIVGAVLFFGVKSMTPRGIRNNNPGNIMSDGSTVWNGQVGVDAGGYLVFSTPEYGMRAMAVNLYHYQEWSGLGTIRAIIERWAPPSTNDTAAYIADVSARLGIAPGAAVNVVQILPQLIPAIIWHENGEQPYTAQQIAQAIQMAGL